MSEVVSPNAKKTRQPAVADMFYPGDPKELADTVDRLLKQAAAHPARESEPASQPPKALIVPHAGYVYSGAAAAAAYALLQPVRATIRRVVLLGPTHRVAVHGMAIPSGEAFATPLGNVPLDREALQQIAMLPQVMVNDEAHAQEHSLEVHLPFLQGALDSFTLIPIAVGMATPDAVAGVLATLWGGPETLIVISSDLSHYQSYEDARRVDELTCRQILHLDPHLNGRQACGAFPANGLLLLARQRGLVPSLVAHCNSGDTAGSRDRVVGYAAIAFHEPSDPRSFLLTAARHAIAAKFGNTESIRLDVGRWPELQQPGASFITLTQKGKLRGCIGSLVASRPLLEDVQQNAVSAAFRDPRFPPLEAGELPMTRIEVSVLTAPEPFEFIDEADALAKLRPLVDGVIFEAGGHRATFLPQVWEQLPDPQTFLAHLKHKAGLPPDYWSEDVRLQRYSVRKWKEGEP